MVWHADRTAGPPGAEALAELRALLPAEVTIWAGGASAALRGLRVAGVRVIATLAQIGEAVVEWRRDRSPRVD